MKYKNLSSQDLIFNGVGLVEAGAEFETELIIENPNLAVVVTPVKTDKLEEKE